MSRRSYVYFIQAADGDGPIKIGTTTSPRSRLASLNTSSPVPLVMLRCVPCHNGLAYEVEIHAMFSESRLRGEWFRPSPELLAMTSGATAVPGEMVDDAEIASLDGKRGVQIAVRVDRSILERADALIDPNASIGQPLATRASVLREATIVGVRKLKEMAARHAREHEDD